MDAVAVARPYAAAVFQHARTKQTVDSWQRVLLQMGQAITAVRSLVADGVLVSGAQASDIALAAAEAGGGVDGEHERFLQLLLENDRVFVLPEIASRFDVLRMEAAGIVAVRVESAMPIKDKKGFNQHLEKRLGKTVEAMYEENSELLGGVRVYVDDDVIDASIRGRLDKLAATLTSGAAKSSL